MIRERYRRTVVGLETGTEARRSEQRSQGLHILVVEDNMDSAVSLAVLLRLWGHEVRIAPDGPAALEAMKDSLPDVALIDIGLPGIDGYEVATWIGKQPCEKKPLLIAVTGLKREAGRLLCTEAGFDLHLLKPVETDRLNKLLTKFQRIIL